MDELTTQKAILDSGLVLGLRLVQTFELFLIFISIISGSVVLLVFYRTPLLHQNLLGLMAMIGSEFFLVMISRVFMLGFSFDNEDYLDDPDIIVKTGLYMPLEVIRCFGCGCIVLGVLCGVIERAIATIYLDTYEQNRSKRLLIIFSFIQIFFSGIFCFFFFTKTLNIMSIVVYGVVITFLFVIIFIFSYRMNSKRYNLSKSGKAHYCLSQRYQLGENMRAFMIIRKTVIYLAIGNIFIFGIAMVINFFKFRFTLLILRSIFNITFILYSILIPVIFVTSVEIWRLKYIRFFVKLKNKFCCRRISIEDHSMPKLQHLRSSNGLQLGFEINQERDLVFENLKKSWNS